MREAIEGGCDTRHAVTRACGAGGDCGACHGMIEDMIEDHLDRAPCPNAKTLVPETALVRKVA